MGFQQLRRHIAFFRVSERFSSSPLKDFSELITANDHLFASTSCVYMKANTEVETRERNPSI